jgi:hypothetical protein
MLKIFFLKKKRFLFNFNIESIIKVFNFLKAGAILCFDYVSLDRDFLFKYKIYGFCKGKKKNYIMSICYLSSNLAHNYLEYVFYIFSPFIFNLKILKTFKYSKMKLHSIYANIRLFNKSKLK